MVKEKSNEGSFTRNNLDKSSSPYLLQHIENPVWWQEWNEETLKYASETNKLLFVSVGYATCHWCHVMAAEAFSDQSTADYLNSWFVCIKVDREQRPDIDQFLMDFINHQNGRGGWPLNVYMTSDLKPVYALTYAPVSSRDSMLSLFSISEKVRDYFEQNSDKIPPFVSEGRPPAIASESSLAKTLSKYYDTDNGGFGSGQKFPPHSSLLYLLYQTAVEDSPSIITIISKTLDAMQLRGLNDHLQGGIFRYCVDREWTIPHFEKMLYDQAMALWSYSLAWKIIGKESYKIMAENILRCLDECFHEDGFYISGHDADTRHEEGSTYIWSYDQLKEVLSPVEFEEFSDSYFISKNGNFEGMNHLIRRNDTMLTGIEGKLLALRRQRKQPQKDDKILCGINGILAISLIQAGRYLNRPDLEEQAAILVNNLVSKFWDGTTLKHSFYKGDFQEQRYLSDAASILTAITMLYEKDVAWAGYMTDFTLYVKSFKENNMWRESWASDFQTVYASWTDHPVPSSVSLAEMGLIRASFLKGEDVITLDYREPFMSDFYNITAMMVNGQFHIFESEKELPWSMLPANSIKVRGKHNTDCFMGTCSPMDKRFLES